MEEQNQIQQAKAQPTQKSVVSLWKNFQIDVCQHHPEDNATHVCIQKDCPDNFIPICDICLDQNHLAHPCKTLRIFCENLQKIVQNSADHQENIGRAFEAKIQNLITSLVKSRYYNTQDLEFLQNKLLEYQEFFVSNQIKRLLSKLEQAKTENRSDDSLSLHKELKKKIKIENNQISFIEISRSNEIQKFEQELDKEIEQIQQKHKFLLDIAGKQRRANSPNRKNQARPFDLFLAYSLYSMDKRFLKNESDSVEQEQRLQQYIDQKIAEENRERAQEINRLQKQITPYQQQHNGEIKRDAQIAHLQLQLDQNMVDLSNQNKNSCQILQQKITALSQQNQNEFQKQENERVAQHLAVNNRFDQCQVDFNRNYQQFNSMIDHILQRSESEKQQTDTQIAQFQQQLDQTMLKLGDLNTNFTGSILKILKLEEQNRTIQEELMLLAVKQIQKINIINQENEIQINRIIFKFSGNMDQKYVRKLNLNKEHIMQENGNKLHQQFKDMKQVFQLKILANDKSLGHQEARNLAVALAAMPQILALKVEIQSNSIANEGAASIAQALSTLTNLTQLSLYLQSNIIADEGAASIALALSTLTNLTQLNLDLNYNKIANEGAASIAEALLTLKNLTQLDLQLGNGVFGQKSNNIADEGAANIAVALSTLKNLTQLTLQIYRNSIKNEGAVSIAQALQILTNLTQLNLDLRENQIQEQQRRQIFQLLDNIPQKYIAI